MKQFITLLSLAGIMASCKNNPEMPLGASSNNTVSESNEASFAEFETWKKQKDMAAFNQSGLVNEPKTTVVYVPQKTTSTVTRQPQTIIKTVPVATQPAEQPVAKKRWSKAAKGAVIGAGTGAVAGAIIHKKNRALGAVIGGVAGGGVGYGIGRGMDKRDGRY